MERGGSRFAFVPNRRPLVRGTIGGLAVLAVIFGWAWQSGRMRYADATYACIMLASVVVAIAFVVTNLWATARKAASALGHLELDDDGIGWRRADGSFGFSSPWKDIERATVDAGNFTLILFRRDGGGAVPIGVFSQHGVPSGFVVPERFGEIVQLVTARVPAAPHRGSGDAAAGRRALGLGAASCLVAAGLYAANLALAALLHGSRMVLPMPIFVGAMGLLMLIGGARIRMGRGPLVSPLYKPSYRATVIRFLVVASVANFALLGLANTLAR